MLLHPQVCNERSQLHGSARSEEVGKRLRFTDYHKRRWHGSDQHVRRKAADASRSPLGGNSSRVNQNGQSGIAFMALPDIASDSVDEGSMMLRFSHRGLFGGEFSDNLSKRCV